MSKYRLLQDHLIGGQVLLAGTTQATADVGGLLPTGWVPTPNVDPLDAAAVAAFYAAGPAPPGAIRQQWLFFPVLAPITYWHRPYTDPFSAEFSREFGGTFSPNQWFLTGLGTGLPSIST